MELISDKFSVLHVFLHPSFSAFIPSPPPHLQQESMKIQTGDADEEVIHQDSTDQMPNDQMSNSVFLLALATSIKDICIESKAHGV